MHISLVYEINFLYSLIVTVFIELVVMYGMLSYVFNKNIKISEVLAVGFLPSFATLPYVWFVFPVFFKEEYALYLWVSEGFVLFVEMFMISYLLKFTLKDALYLSFIANLASYFLGTWIANLVGGV